MESNVIERSEPAVEVDVTTQQQLCAAIMATVDDPAPVTIRMMTDSGKLITYRLNFGPDIMTEARAKAIVARINRLPRGYWQ